MKFFDTAKVTVRSGKGGDGCVAFLREKFRPRGGPSGGNGGKGGDIIVQGDKGLYSLFDLNMNPHINAGKGVMGMGKHMAGKQGESQLIKLPLGTELFDFETGELLMEVIDCEPRVLLAGGKGGLGNAAFASNLNRAPQVSTPGQPGQEVILRLELKLLADVGLVGYPNAGKSTFISTVSKATPKIADYPFTTLQPQLGTVKIGNYSSFVIADIPGIIEGASLGKGLGHRFLRHIEKTSLIMILLDGSSYADIEPMDAYEKLLKELEDYSDGLTTKTTLVALTKSDLMDEERLDEIEKIKEEFERNDQPCFIISAAARSNINECLAFLSEKVTEFRSQIVSVNNQRPNAGLNQ